MNNDDTMIDITIPNKTVSEANSREHYMVKNRRHQEQKKSIVYNFLALPIAQRLFLASTRPLSITLIRIAPRMLDKDDNLPMAFKYIKDYIADFIFPGKACGRADDSSDLHWQYMQEKGKPKQLPSVRIVIVPYAKRQPIDEDYG